jgi:Flp pilus assembly pilin Flp
MPRILCEHPFKRPTSAKVSPYYAATVSVIEHIARDGRTAMKRMLKMLRDEDGAVTVDWVVLTAAVVMLGMLIAPMLKSPVSNLAEAIGDGVEEAGASIPAR